MRTTVTVGDVAGIVETWAPRAIAWDRDNIGLQVGSLSTVVRGILVCLDVTPSTVAEASRRRANLIVSHHPLLFNPLRRLESGNSVSDAIRLAIRHGIDIYSAHTNLDFAQDGVSFALAEALGLNDVSFLSRTLRTKRKIVTYLPAEYADPVAAAMAEHGAGLIGDYAHCSFRIPGTGTFMGSETTSPAIGMKKRFQRVDEVRLEMLADEWQVDAIVAAMKSVHPYEEVAYDIVRLDNLSPEYGMGTIGTLPRPLRLDTFVRRIKQSLGSSAVRHTKGTGTPVSRVALCGGSGSELLQEALRQQADAFVTADVRYHTFQEAEGRIALIDAGHFETEFPAVKQLASKLRLLFRNRSSGIRVTVSRVSTNPVMFA
ncbi:MAG: Nif3-like dinuclear metal center hexameric protein [Ignavibacteria bacterium]|nr:Nif3-like dinuclear metal center hexameric protein [Ignavibacteria bacterium]